MNVLGSSVNGNYRVILFDDGTKVRYGDVDKFVPEKPESIDLKITNKCNMNCLFCHEMSSEKGLHGDIMNLKFIDTLLPYTELAIGGGNPLEHPQLVDFLELLKSKKLIANMTVHKNHFMKSIDFIHDLSERGLIHGVGVSLPVSFDTDELDAIKSVPNTVIHVINGIVGLEELELLAHRDLKLLVLGYKNWGRGTNYHLTSNWLVWNRKILMRSYITTIIHNDWFNTISFDNLAIEQLGLKDALSPEEFNSMYMGDDGQFTMYIDAVKQKFAKTSTSSSRFPITDDISDMFRTIREGC